MGKHATPALPPDGVPPSGGKVSDDTWTKYLENGVKGADPEKWAAAMMAVAESAELN
jgi:hypothetical protein